ncbi:MAG: hypothetical protein NWF01_09460 [Candidatus Bathyarchaeota archaeon]|nr:hypothetical protein [Candidatus Bathyarchaeota archaeon]
MRKFSIKVLLILCALTLSLTFAGAFAQTSSITSITSPTTANLNAVHVVSTSSTSDNLAASNVWAVGDGGVIIHWDGENWVTETSPTTENLYSVCFVNDSSGWAVGGNSDSGIILNYDGAAWTVWTTISFDPGVTTQDTINATLYSVIMHDSGMSGWAVGANGIALSYSAGTWYGLTDVASSTLRSVSMIHATYDGWAVGDNGTFVHLTGIGWDTINLPTNQDLYAIQMTSATSGWACGGSSGNGVIFSMDDSSWTVWDRINMGGDVNSTTGYVTDTLTSPLRSITMNSVNNAWAVGDDGLALYWNGEEWGDKTNSTILGSTALNGVSMVHSVSGTGTGAWAVGDGGQIFAWTGVNWIPELSVFVVVPLLVGVGVVFVLLKKVKATQKAFLT